MENPPENKEPIHIKEIADMVEEYEKQSKSTRINRSSLIARLILEQGSITASNPLFPQICKSVEILLNKRKPEEYRNVVRYVHGERIDPKDK